MIYDFWYFKWIWYDKIWIKFGKISNMVISNLMMNKTENLIGNNNEESTTTQMFA